LDYFNYGPGKLQFSLPPVGNLKIKDRTKFCFTTGGRKQYIGKTYILLDGTLIKLKKRFLKNY
jgi:hypothetical protein